MPQPFSLIVLRRMLENRQTLMQYADGKRISKWSEPTHTHAPGRWLTQRSSNVPRE